MIPFNPFYLIGAFMLVTGVLVPPLGLIWLVVFGPVAIVAYAMDPKLFGDWRKL